VSLRAQFNLLIAVLISVFVGVLLMQQIRDTRDSVREEIEAGNLVATRLLSSFVQTYGDTSRPAMVGYLTHLGRVRATVIRLYDQDGALIYTSPLSPYKAGRDAPAWYAALVAPAPMKQQFDTFDGVLEVTADPSRAILDGWDEALRLVGIGAIAILIGNVLVFALVRSATRPFALIAHGLDEVQRGNFRARLPQFRGAETGAIAQAFNRMAQTIEDNLNARHEAAEARLRLEQSRELAETVRARIEDERREIARELHDETGQSVTAIKSLALALMQSPHSDDTTRGTAQLIADTAGRLYAAMHEMIPRLRPLTLDSLGLADTLREQVAEWRQLHAHVDIVLTIGDMPASLGDTATVAIYRIVQEAVTNALRHANATRIEIDLHADAQALRLRIADDGRGLPENWRQPGHYGLRGIVERARTLGGEARIGNREPQGAQIDLEIPLQS
jgi:two-component system sensor histidine kinase UhpB